MKNYANKEIKFIHLEIKFKKETKDLEIYDAFGPSKIGYKIINYKNNKFFSVFPFYNIMKKIIFGIIEIDSGIIIDDDYISGEYFKFKKQEKQWELSTKLTKENS